MKDVGCGAVTIMVVVVLLVSGCGTRDADSNYANPAWGLSMWYPEDWVYEEGENQVIFATSEQVIAHEQPETGAWMSVEAGDGGWGSGTEGVCALLVMLFAEADTGRWEISDPQPRTLGGQEGCEITFEDKARDVRGFVAGTVYEGWLYLFVGESAPDEWPEHGPDLDTMLDSVQFTTHPEPTPTITRTPTAPPVGDSANQVVEVARLAGEGWPCSVAFAPDGETLASGWALDHTVRLWRVSDGELVQTLNGHTRAVDTVVFSPDGQTLASGSSDSIVRLWRISDGELLQSIDVDPGGVFVASSIAFSPDWQTLASASSGGSLQLWSVSDGELLKTLSGHTGTVTGLAFSPNGEILASASSSSGVQLCRVSDGQLLHSLYFRGLGGARVVAFSPNGQTLASGQINGTVHLWSASDGQLLQTLEGHTGAVYAVGFSPDGEILASGSTDGTVRLWRVSEGTLRQVLDGHTDFVSSVAFSPDGDILASASADGTIRLWGIPVG